MIDTDTVCQERLINNELFNFQETPFPSQFSLQQIWVLIKHSGDFFTKGAQEVQMSSVHMSALCSKALLNGS